jgi:hypothetical protein
MTEPITKVKDAKSPFLKQLFKAMGKSWTSDVDTLDLDATGELVVGVSRSHDMYLGSRVTGKEVVPDEAGLKAFHRKMGFLSWNAGTLAFGPDALVVRTSAEFQVWSWSKGKLTLTHRAKWDLGKKGGSTLTMFDGRVVCTGSEVASLVKVAKPPKGDAFPEWKDRVVAIWSRAKLPKANALAGNARETKPVRQLPIAQELGDVCFALAEDGVAAVAEYVDWKNTLVSRWDASGKRVSSVTLEDVNATDIAWVGAQVVVTTADGALISLDEKGVVKRVKAHADRAVSLRAVPGGEHLVTTSAKELAVFSLDGLKKVAKVAVKGLHDFRVQTVTSTGVVLTNNPPTLFELS